MIDADADSAVFRLGFSGKAASADCNIDRPCEKALSKLPGRCEFNLLHQEARSPFSEAVFGDTVLIEQRRREEAFLRLAATRSLDTWVRSSFRARSNICSCIVLVAWFTVTRNAEIADRYAMKRS